MRRSKRFDEQLNKVNQTKEYDLADAVDLMKDLAKAKFDETVEIAMRLGVDPKHADQMIRGTLSLPNGTGKSVKILVLTKGPNVKVAEESGADYVGLEEYIEKIQKGWLDFDVVVASPDVMSMVGKLGRVLGTRGLMPNPKSGTVTPNVADAVKEIKAGKIDFRVDKTGIIHSGIGDNIISKWTGVLESHNPESVHSGLKRFPWINLNNNNFSSQPGRTQCDSAPNPTITNRYDCFTDNCHIRQMHDRGPGRLPGSISVIK